MGIRPYTRSIDGRFVGGDSHAAKQVPLGCVAPHTAQRCHSEPVTDVTGVGIRSPSCLPLRGGPVPRLYTRFFGGRFVGGDAHIAPPRPQARNSPKASLSIDLSCHSEARSDVGIRNLLTANLHENA